MEEQVPIDPVKEVIAAIVHLVEFRKMEDGLVVAQLPYEMAVYERDLFQRTSEYLESMGGSLQKEHEGFVFPHHYDYQGVINRLLEADGVAEVTPGDSLSEASNTVRAGSLPDMSSQGVGAVGKWWAEEVDLSMLDIF